MLGAGVAIKGAHTTSKYVHNAQCGYNCCMQNTVSYTVHIFLLPQQSEQARSRGGGGVRGATHPPNLSKGPLLATKWAKNGVFVAG